MTLSPWDEYLIHQIPATLDSVGTDNPYFMDRMMFVCHSKDGTLHAKSGLGSYPNVNVMDGFFCVRHHDIQHNIRVSRHLQGDRANTVVGPLAFKVLEPHKRWRVDLEENDYGLSASLEFEGWAEPYLFPELDIKEQTQIHYNQAGHYKGVISIDGETFNADGFLGVRDRTWGIRKPGATDTFDVYLFGQARFPDLTLTYIHTDVMGGDFKMRQGAFMHDDGSVVPIEQILHRIEFVPGTKTYTQVELLIKDAEGKDRHVVARPISPDFYLAGPGYDGRHGMDRGSFNIEGEKWEVAEIAKKDDFRFLWRQREVEIYLDGVKGLGMIESSFGPNPPGAWEYKPSF